LIEPRGIIGPGVLLRESQRMPLDFIITHGINATVKSTHCQRASR
jgi:hypothetical protein